MKIVFGKEEARVGISGKGGWLLETYNGKRYFFKWAQLIEALERHFGIEEEE